MPFEFSPGDVISHIEMCSAIGVSLQRGMYYHLCGPESVVLMSRRVGATYRDQIDQEGKLLIYEGHDLPKRVNGPDPKTVDQPEHNRNGTFTQNGLFAESVRRVKESGEFPERVRVFEKLRKGIWTYNGIFELIDCSRDHSTGRLIFKFTLRILHEEGHSFVAKQSPAPGDDDDRIIPSWVKLEVWKRDNGTCRVPGCGAKTRLHFDHIIPYSKGGSSKDPNNIQILCGRHNLAKRDRIE